MAGLAVAVVLLLANGVFVGAEFALVAAQRARIEQMAAGGDTKAVAAARAMGELSFMLSACQLGITIASLVLGAVAEPAVARLLDGPLHELGLGEATSHTVAFVIALALVVFLHMVVGEMVPKNIAIADPERTVLWLAPPVRAFATAFRPVVAVLNGAANAGLRLLGVEPKDELSAGRTGEELADLLAVSRREGYLEEVEHRLMTGALRFPQRLVASVTVPRDQVVAVSAGTSVARAEAIACTSGHSRLVVFGRDLDDVLGFIHAKDLLGVPAEARGRPLPRTIVRRMLLLRDSATLQEVLLAMRRSRIHAALVVDAAGGATLGIVTLEDVLEALVGDIRDEHDDRSGSGDRVPPDS